MMYQQQQQLDKQDVNEPLLEYGQVDGQAIKLNGLDYSLLQKQSAKDKKNKLLQSIKLKLQDHRHNLPVEPKTTHTRLTQDNDLLTKNITSIYKTKPTISQSTYFIFPILPQFAPLQPEIVIRRFGKMHSEPLYINHANDQINAFTSLIQKDDKIKHLRRQMQKDQKKLAKQYHIQSQGDQDNIFDSPSDIDQQKIDINIKIGSKLNFQIDDNDIFGGVRYKQAVKAKQQEPKVVDKYDFLHKKRKPNESDEGYNECYINVGPSLEQMKQMKLEGIKIFDDAKQYVQKQRKYNIHKDYEKIKRIIDEKSKK